MTKTCQSSTAHTERFSFSSLFVRDDDLLERGRQRVQLDRSEPGVPEHALVLGESISIARGRRSQHDHTERSGTGGSDAIFVGHEFERDGAATRRKRGVDLAQERFDSSGIKMVEEIREQGEVVARAKVDVKRTGGDRPVPARTASRLRIFPSPGEDWPRRCRTAHGPQRSPALSILPANQHPGA